MAKSYKAATDFQIGGDPPTGVKAGDSFPAGSPHLESLVREGYVVEAGDYDESTTGSASLTGLEGDELEVYQDNQGTATDALGQEIDVVGQGTPSAEEVSGEKESKPKPKSSTKKSSAKKSSARRSGPRT